MRLSAITSRPGTSCWLAEYTLLRTLQHHGAAALEPVEVDTEALRLAALVTGLIAARCAAAASAEEARQVLAGHLRSLGQQ